MRRIEEEQEKKKKMYEVMVEQYKLKDELRVQEMTAERQ